MTTGYYSQEEPGDFTSRHEVEVAVIGGGMAGVACAVTAARLGLKTILVQNRNCLGGPAGVECDCDADGSLVCGASEFKTRDARETGVIEDMRLNGEACYVNGWRAYWSQMLRDLCEAEENLTLLLNTEVYDLTMDGARITSLTARTLGSEVTHTIQAETVVDCTGDSFPAFKAGAEFRMGREARAEFQESLAPEKSDRCTLGSSLYFRAVDEGHPVTFVPPPWAHRLPDETPFVGRPHKEIQKGYYWLECGGDLNTIRDNEAIYRELLAILYGVWDHIKNHGDHGADNYAINWIAGFPGKRESRRLMGDYILTQNDILSHRTFPDGVTYGGGNVDIHPIKGFFSGNTPSGPEHGIMSPGLYQIPLRCLYSRNVSNLLMAGRNISTTHVALSSTRLMATCSAGGQAVAGTAYLMRKYGVTARDIARDHMAELRYILYRVDHTVPGITVEDHANLCADGLVQVTSSMALELHEAEAWEPLLVPGHPDAFSALSFVSSTEFLESVQVRLRNVTSEVLRVDAELVEQASMYEFTSGRVVGQASGEVKPGASDDVSFAFHAGLQVGRRYYIRFLPVAGIDIGSCDCYLPTVYKSRMTCPPWPPRGDNHNLCCRFVPEQRPFEGENVINTHNRGGDHASIWISDPRQALPQAATVTFPEARSCSCIELVFDSNLDHLNIYSLQEECVRDYRVEVRVGEAWETVVTETGNHLRFRRHVFGGRLISGIRLTVLGTNGAPSARVYQIRAYERSDY